MPGGGQADEPHKGDVPGRAEAAGERRIDSSGRPSQPRSSLGRATPYAK